MNFWRGILNNLKSELQGTSGNEASIAKKLDKGKEFTINNPTSYRTYHNVGEGTLDKNDIDVGLTSGRGAELASTAIKSARYDPGDGSLNITFQGGNKEYKYAADPDDVKEFVNAPSKGQLIASWNRTGEDPHTYPGY